jgi:hypothetical protein
LPRRHAIAPLPSRIADVAQAVLRRLSPRSHGRRRAPSQLTLMAVSADGVSVGKRAAGPVVFCHASRGVVLVRAPRSSAHLRPDHPCTGCRPSSAAWCVTPRRASAGRRRHGGTLGFSVQLEQLRQP